jgi:hypothetical protein
MIPYPLQTVIDGKVWHPYAVRFESPDGVYECHVYAISYEHAYLQLQALKDTGKIIGRAAAITIFGPP